MSRTSLPYFDENTEPLSSRIVTGLHKSDGGEILVDGVPMEGIHNSSEALDHGIAVVYQDLALVESLVREELAKGGGGRGEPAGNPDARVREPSDHLAERRVLAADRVDVGDPQLVERNDALA